MSKNRFHRPGSMGYLQLEALISGASAQEVLAKSREKKEDASVLSVNHYIARLRAGHIAYDKKSDSFIENREGVTRAVKSSNKTKLLSVPKTETKKTVLKTDDVEKAFTAYEEGVATAREKQLENENAKLRAIIAEFIKV